MRYPEPDAIELHDWVAVALMAGPARLEDIVHELEGDALDIGIDPSAWDNTMAALEWVVNLVLSGRVVGLPLTAEDLQRIRRVHALGASALAGEARSPELLPLARQCLETLRGPQSAPT